MKKNKKLLSNMLFQTAYQMLIIFLPLITTPYIARTLGRVNSGIYSYSYAIADYFVVFAMLGINSYGNREIAKAKSKGKRELDKTFSGIMAVHAALSIAAIVVYVLYTFFFVQENKLVFWAQAVWVFSALFDVNWFFFGIEEFRLTVIRNTIIKIATVILIFVFVKSEQDLLLYTLIMDGGTLLSQLVIWAFIPKYVSFTQVSFSEAVKHLKPMALLFIAVIATSLYRMIDKVMLGQMGTMGDVGVYEYADKIIRIPVALITAIGNVMLPRISSLVAQKNEKAVNHYFNISSQMILALSFAMAFGIAGIADEFVVLFLGNNYSESITLVKILAISIPFMGWNNLVRTQILMPNSLDNVYTLSVWTGAILNIVINALLIPRIGTSGAAIATVLCYFGVGLGQSVPINKKYQLHKYLGTIVAPLICGFAMFASVRFVGKFVGISIWSVVAEIIVGVVTFTVLYGLYSVITRNWLFSYFLTGRMKKEEQDEKI